MGLYYKLSNGEDVEIRIEENEDYEQELIILLFNGSTSVSYPMNKNLMLNDIIIDIEKEYNNLLESDRAFFYKANGFYD
ncbi:MAG: hypothetical protein PHX40_04110 [Bacilli bacterium]|nr:hypothetical protein [Bacilli bacterium]